MFFHQWFHIFLPKFHIHYINFCCNFQWNTSTHCNLDGPFWPFYFGYSTFKLSKLFKIFSLTKKCQIWLIGFDCSILQNCLGSLWIKCEHVGGDSMMNSANIVWGIRFKVDTLIIGNGNKRNIFVCLEQCVIIFEAHYPVQRCHSSLHKWLNCWKIVDGVKVLEGNFNIII